MLSGYVDHLGIKNDNTIKNNCLVNDGEFLMPSWVGWEEQLESAQKSQNSWYLQLFAALQRGVMKPLMLHFHNELNSQRLIIQS